MARKLADKTTMTAYVASDAVASYRALAASMNTSLSAVAGLLLEIGYKNIMDNPAILLEGVGDE